MYSSSMRHQTSHLVAADGLRLFRQSWLPGDGVPRVALAVVHGYGEHGGRLGNLTGALVPQGVAVHVYDLRGHGRSDGSRGHVDRFDRYLADTASFLAAVAHEHAGVPLFLLGHSFGGLIAALYLEGLRVTSAGPPGESGQTEVAGTGTAPLAGTATAPFAGTATGPVAAVLSSPFLELGAPVSRVKLAGARLLSRVAPERDIGNTLLAADLSHDETVVAAYTSDPLNHHVATARWAAETLEAQRQALEGAARLRLPLLVLYGSDDVIAAPGAARRLFEMAASTDKTCLGYEGYYHELFNEVGRQRPLADLAEWLLARA